MTNFGWLCRLRDLFAKEDIEVKYDWQIRRCIFYHRSRPFGKLLAYSEELLQDMIRNESEDSEVLNVFMLEIKLNLLFD